MELGWESLQNRRKKLRVLMLYKIINNVMLLTHNPVTRMESSYYNSRDFNNQRIYLPYCQTDTCKASVFPEAIDLWNLPQQIIESSSFLTFT